MPGAASGVRRSRNAASAASRTGGAAWRPTSAKDCTRSMSPSRGCTAARPRRTASSAPNASPAPPNVTAAVAHALSSSGEREAASRKSGAASARRHVAARTSPRTRCMASRRAASTASEGPRQSMSTSAGSPPLQVSADRREVAGPGAVVARRPQLQERDAGTHRASERMCRDLRLPMSRVARALPSPARPRGSPRSARANGRSRGRSAWRRPGGPSPPSAPVGCL